MKKFALLCGLLLLAGCEQQQTYTPAPEQLPPCSDESSANCVDEPPPYDDGAPK